MKLVIIGGGGHAKVVAEAALISGLQAISVLDPKAVASWPFEFAPCLATDEEAGLYQQNSCFVVALGDNVLRQKLQTQYEAKNFLAHSVIHPQAMVSPSAEIADGCMIMAGAIVGPLAKVGKGVIVNHGAIIEHDCSIGDYAHIAPGAVLAGQVRIGARCFIGANACVRHGLALADDLTIGLGAVVTRHLTASGTFAGNPARLLQK